VEKQLGGKAEDNVSRWRRADKPEGSAGKRIEITLLARRFRRVIRERRLGKEGGRTFPNPKSAVGGDKNGPDYMCNQPGKSKKKKGR